MLPQSDKRIVVTSGKNAYQGTLSATKNIDLTEDGYIKLSAPMCRVYSSEDTSDFPLPYDIFTRTDGTYKVLGSSEDTYELSLASLGVVIDSTFAGGTDGLRVVPWVGNNWFINADNAIYDYTGATVSTVYTSRISDVLDFIALFVSLNTLVGRDADNVNVLKQYSSAFANTTDLTLPANFAITGAAFSNEQMGVITKQRKNQGNAIFAVWDGSTAAANAAYEVNDPYILDVASYKSTWVILTSRGQLLAFNGGSFEELGRLPTYDLQQRLVDFTPTTSIVFGKLIHVDGDRIYVNCASLPESAKSMKPYHPFYSGGAWCYDPKNSFYHTAAPSYSEYKTESITFASDIGTTASAHYLETGDEMFATSASNEIKDSTVYYAIRLTDTTFKLATTYENAIAGTSLTITNAAYAFNYVKRYDYGIEAIKLQDCGLVRNEKDYSGYTDSGAFPFFLGAKVHPNNLATTRINALCMAVPVMSNIGSFVIGKFQTGNLQDSWQKVAVKYSKLKNGDKIIVKAKTKECEPVIVGDPSLFATSAYSGKGALWDGSGTYFTTTEDLTGVEEGDEVHIFAGPGAGQSAHIVTINGNVTDGWEVILDEKIRGTVSGRVSCVSIDKFKKCGVITKDDTEGVKVLVVGNPGTSMEVKGELRGIGVKVSGIIPIHTSHQAAL
jgi:hypothetical protein